MGCLAARRAAKKTDAEKRSYVEKMSKEFNTPVRVVTDVNELTHGDATTERRMRRSKGWYDTKTGEVVVVMPNNGSVEDVAATIFHEVYFYRKGDPSKS